jgi:CPA2 family monovalent cation:H+ antiporter-2
MQDFIVVPLLVIVPLLSKSNDSLIMQAVGAAFLKAMVALVVIFVVGRIVLRPLFKIISTEKSETSNELFIAVTLLIVLGAAWSTEHLGLSLALGAFVSGILVAETEFRTKAEESIHPFKGLFLGLFFMSVGMNIDVMEIYNQLGKVLVFSFALIFIKALIIIGLCLLFGMTRSVAIHTGFMLAQGGEFAFILFKLAMSNNVLDPNIGNLLLLVVTVTMALTPFLESVGRYLGNLLDGAGPAISPIRDIGVGVSDLNNHVIIAGFGQVGKMIAKVLEAEDINYVALDINEKLVAEEKESGFPIFKGDISQLGTLKASGAERALCVVLATESHVTLKKSLKTLSENYPGLEVVIRAKDLNRSAELYEAGATTIIPVDYETGLQLGGAVLKYANISEYEIVRIKSQFRAGNYVTAQIDEELFDAQDNE